MKTPLVQLETVDKKPTDTSFSRPPRNVNFIDFAPWSCVGVGMGVGRGNSLTSAQAPFP